VNAFITECNGHFQLFLFSDFNEVYFLTNRTCVRNRLRDFSITLYMPIRIVLIWSLEQGLLWTKPQVLQGYLYKLYHCSPLVVDTISLCNSSWQEILVVSHCFSIPLFWHKLSPHEMKMEYVYFSVGD
jgi:hypothetical protein